MDIFYTGTDVLLPIPLVDGSGAPLDASAVSYRVTDADGVEVIAQTDLSGFTPSDPIAVIAVLAANNTLASGVGRALRALDLLCTTAAGTVAVSASYLIQTADPLMLAVNSFQTLAQAEFTAANMPNLPGWDAATKDSRIAALMDARQHINLLNFTPINGNSIWGQDSLNFVPEGSFGTPFAATNGAFIWAGDLSYLTPAQFATLPARFSAALKMAQVAEANYILGGDPEEDNRRTGLLSDAVGESRQSYRARTPLDIPVSKRALRYLAMFITFNKRIGR